MTVGVESKAESKARNLGRAMTALHLEDKFLGGDAVTSFGLAERGEIVDGIVSEKLRRGDWTGVVRMIYGGFGNANALYEGDRTQLEKEIVQSAVQSAQQYPHLEDCENALQTLKESGEHDLIFRLATSVTSLSYEGFNKVIRHISSSYFNDKAHPERSRAVEEVAARKALQEEKYSDALHHFQAIGDEARVQEVIDTLISKGDFDFSDKLEGLVLSIPEKREDRLRRIVIALSKRKGYEAVNALVLCKRHNVPLSDEERRNLYERVAEKAGAYDIGRVEKFAEPEGLLLWAKKNAQKEPRIAYRLFRELGYHGEEVQAAVCAGLRLEKFRENEAERALSTEEVQKEDLEKAYVAVPPEIKARIARQLGDKEKLLSLSRQAAGTNDMQQAYNLWVDVGRDLNGEFITGLREEIIRRAIKKREGIFLRKGDEPGKLQAYDALMQAAEADPTNRKKYHSEAYEFAVSMKEDLRLQRVREAMVAYDPEWALSEFRREQTIDGERKADPVGIDYLLGVVASQYGADKDSLAIAASRV